MPACYPVSDSFSFPLPLFCVCGGGGVCVCVCICLSACLSVCLLSRRIPCSNLAAGDGMPQEERPGTHAPGSKNTWFARISPAVSARAFVDPSRPCFGFVCCSCTAYGAAAHVAGNAGCRAKHWLAAAFHVDSRRPPCHATLTLACSFVCPGLCPLLSRLPRNLAVSIGEESRAGATSASTRTFVAPTAPMRCHRVDCRTAQNSGTLLVLGRRAPEVVMHGLPRSRRCHCSAECPFQIVVISLWCLCA